MSESAIKCIKRYVDNLKDRSKLICFVHGPGNSSYECKVLGDLGFNYYKSRPTKYCGNDPKTKKKIGRQQDNNATVHREVDDIILQDNKKWSAED